MTDSVIQTLEAERNVNQVNGNIHAERAFSRAISIVRAHQASVIERLAKHKLAYGYNVLRDIVDDCIKIIREMTEGGE
jgi:hypothetical protein